MKNFKTTLAKVNYRLNKNKLKNKNKKEREI